MSTETTGDDFVFRVGKHMAEQRAKDRGDKFDADKPMWDLFMWRAALGVVRVLTYGAKKYSAHNWEKGIKYSRLFAAAQRHLSAYWLGANIDPESNLPHLDHAICDLMMMREMSTLHPSEDDRVVLRREITPADKLEQFLTVDPAWRSKMEDAPE